MERPSYVIKLDLIDKGVVDTSVRIKQGDSGSIIYLKVYNNGNEYYNEDILPDVYFRRPDGSTVIGSAISGTLNMYVYSIVGNELEIPGTIIMDVKFKLESGRESTASCKFECVQDTLGDSVSSSDIYWNDAAEILQELDAAIAIAQPIIDDGQAIIAEIGDDVVDAERYANTAKSYAVGTSNDFRPGDATDNAKYYHDKVATMYTQIEADAQTASTSATTASNAATTATTAVSGIDAKVTQATNAATSAKNDADRAEAAAQSLGPATTSDLGLVKPDGTSITVDSDGTIHGSASVDIATTTKAGIVKPDGTTITVDADGTIHGSASTPDNVALLDDPTEETTADPRDADTLEGHNASYFGTAEQISSLNDTTTKLTKYNIGEETLIGYRNGKGIYRKIVDCGALPNATTKNVSAYNASYKIINIHGCSTNSAGTIIPIPYTDGSATNNISYVRLSASNGNIVLKTLQDWTVFSSTEVTIEYMKE